MFLHSSRDIKTHSAVQTVHIEDGPRLNEPLCIQAQHARVHPGPLLVAENVHC